MISKLILILTFLLTLSAIRIHKLDQIYSSAGINHYNNLKYQHEDNTPMQEHDLHETSPEHEQGWNNSSNNRNGNNSFSQQRPSSTKVNFSYSNKPINSSFPPSNSGPNNFGNSSFNNFNGPNNFRPTNSGFFPGFGGSSGNNSFTGPSNNNMRPPAGPSFGGPTNSGYPQPGNSTFGGPTNSGFSPSGNGLFNNSFGPGPNNPSSGLFNGPSFGYSGPMGGNMTNFNTAPNNNQWENSTWSPKR